MGGGGGGGFADNGEPVAPGGNGGAIVFIITNSFSGNSFSIVDTGQSIRYSSDESAGGGGGGGTVLFKRANYSSPVTVNTSGGYGGSTYITILPHIVMVQVVAQGGGLMDKWFYTFSQHYIYF